jgi:hypothetical protein
MLGRMDPVSEQSDRIEEPVREAPADRHDLALRLAQLALDVFMYGLIAFALGASFYATL